jgi:hypothetical protein
MGDFKGPIEEVAQEAAKPIKKATEAVGLDPVGEIFEEATETAVRPYENVKDNITRDIPKYYNEEVSPFIQEKFYDPMRATRDLFLPNVPSIRNPGDNPDAFNREERERRSGANPQGRSRRSLLTRGGEAGATASTSPNPLGNRSSLLSPGNANIGTQNTDLGG